jgi:hypothetical protein
MKPPTVWHRAASLIGGAASPAFIAAVGSGCSGINASKSLSPLDFILPGLMQSVPPAPVIPSATNAPPELVQTTGGRDCPGPNAVVSRAAAQAAAQRGWENLGILGVATQAVSLRPAETS